MGSEDPLVTQMPCHHLWCQHSIVQPRHLACSAHSAKLLVGTLPALVGTHLFR